MMSRTRFLRTASAPGVAVAAAGLPVSVQAETSARPVAHGPEPTPVMLRVNGTQHTLQLEPRVTLLDALRERLGLFGTKKGCDQGSCGACTTMVDGRRVNSCLTLAIMVQGKQITTIEGLAQGDQLNPVQSAFLEHDGYQCGYCTSGQIVSATAFLTEGRPTDDASIREWMSGNICRCGAYTNIVAAIGAAAGRPA